MTTDEMISEMEMEFGYTPSAWDRIVAKLRAAEELARCVGDEVLNDSPIFGDTYNALEAYHNAGKGDEG